MLHAHTVSIAIHIPKTEINVKEKNCQSFKSLNV